MSWKRMWTPTTRQQHRRVALRYDTDLTDAEWAVISPLMPAAAPCRRPPIWSTWKLLNATVYRRLWKDPEATLASAEAFLYAAAVMILVRRLTCAS